MKRLDFAVAAILVLCGTSIILTKISIVRADETFAVYIRADGSVDPPTAPIQRIGDTYTMTDNITSTASGIQIEKDSVTVDGAGYALQGTGKPIWNSSGGTLSNYHLGVTLNQRTNVTIRNIRISEFAVGISLNQSISSGIDGKNIVGSNYVGIGLYWSNYSIVSGCNMTNNEISVVLEYSINNTISGNNIDHRGFDFEVSNNNTVTGNSISDCEGTCIFFFSSIDNRIYDNIFVNDTEMASVTGGSSGNMWDNGSRGNYYSDYLARYPNATEIGSSGIWNTPYSVRYGDIDHYPLVVPEFPSFLILLLFMMATLLAVIIYRKKGVKTRQS